MPNEAMDIRVRVESLKSSWTMRQAAIRKWYSMVKLYNDLHQDNMESVISSDPRTSYNMALWLLQPRTGVFVADTDGLTEAEILAAGSVQTYADSQLRLVNRSGQGKLFGPFTGAVLKFMLTTGWYSVTAFPTANGWHMQCWNPAQVFPDYDSDGVLVELGRVYTVSAAHAMRKVKESGWIPPSRPWVGSVSVFNHWRLRDGVPEHAVVIGTHLAKPYTPTDFARIPVYTMPVAGLPDDGGILADDSWKSDVGQALIAPIADLSKNYDKMLTYMQQLLRDTANPRWVEKVKQGGVLTPEKLFQRGAIFSIEPDEDVGPLQTPSIPVEMRSHQFDIRAQLQRGSFSDISFGGAVANVSAFMMSNVTATSKQILDPFREALMGLLGEIATDLIQYQRKHSLKMGKDSWPEQLPDQLKLNFVYDIQIPGDFAQRANSAKVLNPDFKVSSQTLTEVLFPEVQSFVEEEGRLASEEARRHPAFKRMVVVRELHRAAREATELGDFGFAQSIQQVIAEIQQGQADTAVPNQAIPRQALPPELEELLRS